MSLFEFERIEEKEVIPGFHGHFVHTENNTLAYWRIDRGAKAAEHTHPHEQSVIVLEGELDLIVEGITNRLIPGKVYVLAGGVPHAAVAVTTCKLLDVFYPVREDFR